MARPNRPKRDSKNTKNERTSWKKPDGTPLRKRKGDYFPDQEIDKRTTPRRRFESSDDSQERPRRNKDRPSDDRSRSYGNREEKPFGGRSSEKPWDRKGDGRKGDRAEKPFEKKAPFDRKERSGSERKSSVTSRDGERDANRKPWGDERSGKRSPDRKPFGKDRGDKPSWKKRERYDRIEHSENMGNRFDRPKRTSRTHSSDQKERRPQKKSFEADTQGAIRLNRYISNAGICSRREADDLISAGVISINGEVVTELGTKVMPGDEVRFHDRVLRGEKMVYVLLNKPKDYITTTDDPDDRKTVMNLVQDACKERIFPVGRLDRNTTGLLLLTNDGDLTKKLTHPSSNIAKVYQVELDKNLTLQDMQRASDGVELEDGIVAFDNIEYASPTDKKIVGVELHSGKNRIVRRMFEEMGYEVKKLDRTVFAGLTKKDLPRGRWRFLTELEVNALKMMKGGKSGGGRRG